MTVRVLFDTTRLAWRARRGSPTGIDRVLLAYAERLLVAPDVDLQPVALVGDRLAPLAVETLRRMIDDMRAADHDGSNAVWRALTDALRVTPGPKSVLRRPVEASSSSDHLVLALDVAGRALRGALSPAPKGDIYLNVAHTGLHHAGLFSALARDGVRSAVMVHDLIPITHPEYCTPKSAARHARRIDNVIDHVSLVIANSQATADALRLYAEETGRAAPPTVVAPLGVEEAFSRAAPMEGPHVPYFVCVGTIEARKNLAFLLAVWRRLAETLGPDAPHLVLVGRRGWENEAVVDHLERATVLHSLVHEVADLTDEQLASLMSGARAVLAPSFAEGFDLPVAEARALGVRVIASDIDVHRELAADAELVDPLDGPGWLSAIRRALDEDRERTTLRVAGWNDHFARIEPHLSGLVRSSG